jgi:hypothetical protein
MMRTVERDFLRFLRGIEGKKIQEGVTELVWSTPPK